MLGIDVAKSTVEKYRPKRFGPPSPTWRTFLDQHVRDLVSIDFFIVPTATLHVLFVFIVLAHNRRRIVHFNVTEHPTAQWTAQQIVEAFPFDTAPSYLIRDGDGVYGERVTRRIERLCGKGNRNAMPRTFRPRHRTQRAASQETYVVVSGLLPSVANTRVLE